MDKENIIEHLSFIHSPRQSPKPLSNRNSYNSLSGTKSSPLLPPIRMEKKPSTSSLSPSNASTYSTPGKEAKKLERLYSELLIKYNNLILELNQVEQELIIKNKTINDQLEQISNYEKFLSHVKIEFGKTKELMEKELLYYKEMIEDYQLNFLKLNNELEYYRKMEFAELEAHENSDERYNKLLRDFKVLKSNFEVEQNSKIMLMDQIEYLTKENEKLKDDIQSVSDSNTHVNHTDDLMNNFEATNNSVINNYNYSIHSKPDIEEGVEDALELYMQEDYEATSLEIYEAGDIDDSDFSYLDGIGAHSSPLKRGFEYQTPKEPASRDDRVPSLIQTQNFQFPPSPDPVSKTKRQSLPANLQGDFVLSPLKLASVDFESTAKQSRYSISKPTHSRYSSHDILPIKVEFEDAVDQRSTSVPSPGKFNTTLPLHKEEEHNDEPEDGEQQQHKAVLESTFKKLNGDRSSYTSSSKRSSLIFENANNLNPNELTKQELMKLKFELQSLKLHNEKLLSYIGFELQKQKRNIKKLSSRQNLKMEYSDSKLIERSRELLIQKKRVLRSVSINTILSKNYNNRDNVGILQKGIINFNEDNEAIEEDDEQEDDYGFLNFNDKFSKRIFSNGLTNYYEMENNDESNLKKFKSQNFQISRDFDLSDIDISLTSFEDSIDEECEWEAKQTPIKNIGLFNQIKYLLTGSYKTTSSEKHESSVDDSLKYQFFSIAIGILIIGVRFGHYNHHNQV